MLIWANILMKYLKLYLLWIYTMSKYGLASNISALKIGFYEFLTFLWVTIIFKPCCKMQFSFKLCSNKSKMGAYTDVTHSKVYCITHFNSCQHSKIGQEQKVSKFCIYSINRLQVVPAIVYISAVGTCLWRAATAVYTYHTVLTHYIPYSAYALQCFRTIYSAYWRRKVLTWHLALENRKMYLKFWLCDYFTNFILRVENTVEKVYWIFLKTADQSYLVKIFLIMHNKCSQAYIAHNSVNRSHAEQCARTN